MTRPGRAKGLSLAGGLWLVLACLAGCGGGAEEGPSATPVAVSPVIAKDLEEHIEATGELFARDQARIAAEVSGRITQLVLEEGDVADAGAAVLEIDTQRRKLDVDSAAARLVEASASLREQQRELERVRELKRQEVASQSQLDQAETALQTTRSRVSAAEAAASLARRALEDASVRAPFSGRIARRLVSRGEYVNVGQALFELVAMDPIEVEFHLAEVDSGRVRLGQTLAATVSPFPGEEFQGSVTIVSPTIDPRTRTLRVRAQMANPDGRLKPGLFARVDLGVSHRAGVVLVPEESVLQRADGSVVFRLRDDGSVERRLIETGGHHDGHIEVVSGIESGDRVVTRGHADLVDGVKVSVRNSDGSESTPAVASGAAEADQP